MPGVKRKSTASEPNSTSKPVKKQKRPAEPLNSFLSAEYVVDSSDDEKVEEGAETRKSPGKSAVIAGKRSSPSVAPKKSAPNKPKPRTANSQSGSLKKPNLQNTPHSSTIPDSGTSQSSGEYDSAPSDGAGASVAEVQDTTDGEGEHATDSENTDEVDPTGGDGREQRVVVQSTPGSIPEEPPPPPYHPPPGFEASVIKSSSRVHDLFIKENLRGKQVWHVTAPKSLPVTSVKEVPLSEVASGNPIISYKDANYGIAAEVDADHGRKMVLMPSPKDNCYRSAEAEIAQTLRLQEIVKLPLPSAKAKDLPNGASKLSKSHVKIVREQPAKLRMRYRPFGDDTSSEEVDAAPRFKMPPIVSPAKPSKSSKPTEEETRTSPTKEGISIKKGATSSNANSDARNSSEAKAKPHAKRTTQKPSSKDPAERALPDGQKPGGIPDENAQHKPQKKKKERRASGSRENWEAEEARRILATSKPSTESTKSANHDSKDAIADEKEPQLIRKKRKKRKSEATEEV
ncbi:MAG: hypothetical protein Q9219_002834 [cf. Caloplaca sp. 3 TL-2023]